MALYFPMSEFLSWVSEPAFVGELPPLRRLPIGDFPLSRRLVPYTSWKPGCSQSVLLISEKRRMFFTKEELKRRIKDLQSEGMDSSLEQEALSSMIW